MGVIAVLPTMSKFKASKTLQWSVNKRFHAQVEGTNSDIIWEARTVKSDNDHVALPPYLPYFLHRRGAHIVYLLSEFIQVIIKDYSPTEIERTVWSDGIEKAGITATKIKEHSGLCKIFGSD